jgi:hypothetical protein
MLQANMNVTAVARTLGCKRLAIHRLRRRFQMTGSTKDRPRSRRSKVTSPADSFVSVTYVIGSCQQRHRPMLFRVDVSVCEPSEGD